MNELETVEAPRSPCGMSAKIAETPSAAPNGWCEAGMSGAHLVTDRRWYCDNCQWFGPLIESDLPGQRSCPADCEWSRDDERSAR